MVQTEVRKLYIFVLYIYIHIGTLFWPMTNICKFYAKRSLPWSFVWVLWFIMGLLPVLGFFLFYFFKFFVLGFHNMKTWTLRFFFSYYQNFFNNYKQTLLVQQQYIFIYNALLEHHLYGDTEIEASEVTAHIDELNQRLPGNVTGMEHEFRVSFFI